MSDTNGKTTHERLAFLEAEQAKDRGTLSQLQKTTETIRQNVLVRAGRIDELKRIAAEVECGG